MADIIIPGHLCKSLTFDRDTLMGFIHAQPGPTETVTVPAPDLDWNFQSSASLTDSVGGKTLSFARSTIDQAFNVAGTMVEVAINAPVWVYDRTTHALKGLRNQAARAQLLTAPRDLTDAAWTKVNGTAAKTVTGLDGVANSASRFTATAANATFSQTVTSASAIHCMSLYIKRVTGTGAVAISIDGGTTLIDVTSTLGADFALVAFNQSVTNPTFWVRLAVSGDVVDVEATQMEVGEQPSSRILTTTTRDRDIIDITTATLGASFSPTQGTWVVEFTPQEIVAGGTTSYLNVSDGTTNNRYFLFISNNEKDRVQVATGGTDQAVKSFDTPLPQEGTRNWIACAYKENDFLFMNADGTVFTDTSGTLPVVSTVEVGRRNTGSYGNGVFHRIRYWKTRLTDAELGTIRVLYSGEGGGGTPPGGGGPPDPEPPLTPQATFVPTVPGYTLPLVKQELFSTGTLDTATWRYIPTGERFKPLNKIQPTPNTPPVHSRTAADGSSLGNGKYGYWSPNAVDFPTVTDPNDGTTQRKVMRIKCYAIPAGQPLPGVGYTSGVTEYATGGIETETKYTKKYGYFVSRIRPSQGFGWWPSFWIMTPGANVVRNPATASLGAEYDIWEDFRSLGPVNLSKKMNMAYHYNAYGTEEQKGGPNGEFVLQQQTLNNKDKFHEFGFLWTPTKLVWYVDGVQIGNPVTDPDHISHIEEHLMCTGEVGHGCDWNDSGTYRYLDDPLAVLPDEAWYDWIEVYDLVAV